MDTTHPTPDQYSGCLIGQALGDALGFPFEGSPPSVCAQFTRELLPRLLSSGGKIWKGRGHFRLGQYTDDTQLARELLLSYIEHKDFDPADYAQRIARLFENSQVVGRSRLTEKAAWRLIEGAPWNQAGNPPPAPGNGSAMRAAPIGLLYFDRKDELIEKASLQGRITHRDPRCSAGAVAIAGAVALALAPPPIVREEFIETLADWTHLAEPEFPQYLKNLQDWLTLAPEEARLHISQLGLDRRDHRNWPGIAPFAISTVLWSLYSFLRSPDNYVQVIATAIEGGGDADTTAAMAGAISGAHLGLSNLPTRLSQRLTDQGQWGCKKLQKLAEEAYRIKFG